MANIAIRRRTDYVPGDFVPASYSRISAAGETLSAPNTNITAALSVIAAYVPTEILTLYVAFVAALPTADARSKAAGWWLFGAFLLLTPLIVWVLYAVKLKSDGNAIPAHPKGFPQN